MREKDEMTNDYERSSIASEEEYNILKPFALPDHIISPKLIRIRKDANQKPIINELPKTVKIENNSIRMPKLSDGEINAVKSKNKKRTKCVVKNFNQNSATSSNEHKHDTITSRNLPKEHRSFDPKSTHEINFVKPKIKNEDLMQRQADESVRNAKQTPRNSTTTITNDRILVNHRNGSKYDSISESNPIENRSIYSSGLQQPENRFRRQVEERYPKPEDIPRTSVITDPSQILTISSAIENITPYYLQDASHPPNERNLSINSNTPLEEVFEVEEKCICC